MSAWHEHSRLLLAKILNVESFYNRHSSFVSCAQKFCKPAKWCSEIFIALRCKCPNWYFAVFFNFYMCVYIQKNNLKTFYEHFFFYRFAKVFCLWFWPQAEILLWMFLTRSRSRLFDSILIHWMWHYVHCYISQSNNLHSHHCTFL